MMDRMSYVQVTTLGTMHGAPPPGDALVIDLSDRLHNPDKHPDLRGLTGLDPALRAHVLATPGAEEAVQATVARVLALLPHHDDRALGLRVQCRWGRHRSVALAEESADRLRTKGVAVEVSHRDVARDPVRPQDGCEFCAIARGNAQAQVVQEWDDVIAIRPRSGGVHPGHVLVLPRAHVADATVAPAITAATMQAAAEYAADAGGDLNILTSKGESATQTVYHLHVHVVPRSSGDGLALPWSPTTP